MNKTCDNRFTVAFMHNSLAEYRIAFWNNLNTRCDVTILLTTKGLEDKIYGLNKGTLNVPVQEFDRKNIKHLCDYERVILPPIDSILNFMIACQVNRVCHGKTVLWTEKWEPPKNKQPVTLRIKNWIVAKMIYIVGTQADICVVSGTKARDYLNQIGIDGKKIKIVIESSTSESSRVVVDFTEKYGISKEDKVILYLGRIMERKGPHNLIKAFKAAQLPNCKLLVCGEGAFLSQCKRLAEGSENIIFAGKVQPENRKQYYERADFFVIPSIILHGVDVWGLTVNESLECGTPVIASTAVGAAYDLIDENNGMVYDENDVDELTKCLKSALGSKIWDKETIRDDYRIYNVENMAKNFYLAVFDD